MLINAISNQGCWRIAFHPFDWWAVELGLENIANQGDMIKISVDAGILEQPVEIAHGFGPLYWPARTPFRDKFAPGGAVSLKYKIGIWIMIAATCNCCAGRADA